jgi:3-oxoacyl-[acyl-carrier-protein] synthase II
VSVVITGIGLVTALGTGAEETWKAVVAGRTGIGPLSLFDASSLHTQIGAEILDFDPLAFTDRRTLRMMTRNDQLALAGASVAITDSGIDLETVDANRAALFCGGNKEISKPSSLLDGALVARDEDGKASYAKLGAEAASAFHPLFFVEGLQAASLFYISAGFGLKGANTYFAGTADAGITAIGRAYRAVKRGEADVAIAGGFDDAVSWWTMSKMDTLGVLSDHNELGAAACRPYDVHRSGSVLGEGSAFVVLEREDAAKARNAPVYAEVSGFGSGFDAYALLTPHPQGRGLVHAMRGALREAGSAPEDIDYIATHGCATSLGDRSETVALRTALGAAADTVLASSVKPATGHLVAGAGALNVAMAAMAVKHNVVPPTLNLDEPDPACDMDWVPNEAREAQVNQALALARGLEGQNVAVALRAVG